MKVYSFIMIDTLFMEIYIAYLSVTKFTIMVKWIKNVWLRSFFNLFEQR